MEALAPILLGLLLIALGITNFRGNISSIHRYNRRRVTEEDAPKYGKVMGVGTMLAGAGVLLSGVLESLLNSELVWFIAAACLIAALGLMLYGQFKYNHGIF